VAVRLRAHGTVLCEPIGIRLQEERRVIAYLEPGDGPSPKLLAPGRFEYPARMTGKSLA
jgi:hypothetical protein